MRQLCSALWYVSVSTDATQFMEFGKNFDVPSPYSAITKKWAIRWETIIFEVIKKFINWILILPV